MTAAQIVALIQKTLLQIEGVGRQLYPDLDLWETAQPLLKQWMRERYSLKSMIQQTRKQLPGLIDAMRKAPQLIQQVTQRAVDGRLSVPVESKDLEVLRQEIRNDARRRDVTVVAAIVLLGGIFWFALHRDPLWPGVVMVIASAAALWYSRR